MAVNRALTPRQRELVQLTAGGLRDAEIARALGISVWTVKGTLAVVQRKLGARGRAHCAAICWARGEIRQEGRNADTTTLPDRAAQVVLAAGAL